MSEPFSKIARDPQKKALLREHVTKGVAKALKVVDSAQQLKAALESAAAELEVSPKLFKFLGRLYDEGDLSTQEELKDAQERLEAITQLKKEKVL